MEDSSVMLIVYTTNWHFYLNWRNVFTLEDRSLSEIYIVKLSMRAKNSFQILVNSFSWQKFNLGHYMSKEALNNFQGWPKGKSKDR